MVAKAHTVEFIRTQSESEALFLESNMIKEHQPAYNSLLKGDNSYGFIKITNEKFPQIFFTRKRSEDGATYIGPKRYSSRIKHVLHYLRQLFKYRGCKTTQFRQGKLCSDYYRGICSGRCVFAKLNVNSPQARALIDQAHKQ
jgi:excinuclease ABC subunit C